MYVANGDSSTISVIDVNNNLINTITVPGPINNDIVLEFNPVNNNIYAANIGSNTVSVIDINNNIVDNIVVGNNPRDIEFSPANNIYVANSFSDTVSIIPS